MSNNDHLVVHIPKSEIGEINERFRAVFEAYEERDGWATHSDRYSCIIVNGNATYRFTTMEDTIEFKGILASNGVPYETFPAEAFDRIVSHDHDIGGAV